MISIIWGLALSTFLHRTCNGKNCHSVEYRTPENVENKIYYLGKKENPECYRYIPYAVKC